MEKIRDLVFKDSPATDDHFETKTEFGASDVQALNLSISKSNEFDPITTNGALDEVIADDGYAAVHVEDDSPYPEVRSAVPSTDDPSLPQNTIRMVVIGFILTTIGSGMNLLFSLHSPSLTISTYVTSILAYPIGRAWEKIVPNWTVFGLPLNPGPFNLKEHAIVTIMGSVSFGGGTAYATDILLAQNQFYKSDFGIGYSLCMILSTQLIGLSMGGLARKFLVEPSSAIWPANLVTSTFLTNMHINENHPANGWRMSRLKFFSVVFICSFIWYFFPGYIFQFFSYLCWCVYIKPSNIVVNQIFGASTGLGLLQPTLDWNQVSGYIGSPLIPNATVMWTVLASIVIIFWIITPILYYKNVWYSRSFPISSSDSYDRFGQDYNVSKIVNVDTLTFDKTAYREYSPLFLSTTFAISYGLSFASTTATIVHTILFHGKDIVRQFKSEEKPDVHLRLVRKSYREVPWWWYFILFLISFALSIATIRAWPTEMPVWGLIVALIIAGVFLLPVGIIYSQTNIAVGLNVISELIVGYMIPGKPLCMMLFKTFLYITNNQAVLFAQDMKLGQYMHISPVTTFVAQALATVWSCFVQLGVLRWAYGAIDNLCDQHQANGYTCPNGRVFFNALIIWGVIGPKLSYSAGQIYHNLTYFFLIGAVLPVIIWAIRKKYSKFPLINTPVFWSATGYIPPANCFNYFNYSLVGLIFGFFIKKRYFAWWSKYNYSLSAGLDIGLAWLMLMIFLCLNLTNAKFPTWWGNSVIETPDYLGTAISDPIPSGGSVGPSLW